MIASETLVSKPLPGFGFSWRISAEHIKQVFLVHAAKPLERREVAPCQQFEVGNEGLHGGIEAILLLQLDRQAFGQAASKDTGRIKGLQLGKNTFGGRRIATQSFADVGRVAVQVTRLVELVDQLLRDQPVARIRQDEWNLLRKVISQRDLACNKIVEIVILSVAAPGIDFHWLISSGASARGETPSSWKTFA